MSEKKIKIFLSYKKEIREMNFIPKSYYELNDYFLSIFEQKSSKKFIFYFNDQNNQKKIFEEKQDLFQNTINEISQQNNPKIFISEEDINSFSNDDVIDKIFSGETYKSTVIYAPLKEKNETNKKNDINKIKPQVNNYNEIDNKETQKAYILKCDFSCNKDTSHNNDNPGQIENPYKKQNTNNVENPYKINDNINANDLKDVKEDELKKDGNEEKKLDINSNQNLNERNINNNIVQSISPFPSKEMEEEKLNDIKENKYYIGETYENENDFMSNYEPNNKQMENPYAKDKIELKKDETIKQLNKKIKKLKKKWKYILIKVIIS